MRFWIPLIRAYLILAADSCSTSGAAVGSIGFTVSEMDRSVVFDSEVLAFKPLSDVEVDRPHYDQLWGVFGVQARTVRMQRGDRQHELIEFLPPSDVRPIPVSSYSHDFWFQHIALVMRDMEVAWARLRKPHIRQSSPCSQTIPLSNRAIACIKAIQFRDPDGHILELLWFLDGKDNSVWRKLISLAHPCDSLHANVHGRGFLRVEQDYPEVFRKKAEEIRMRNPLTGAPETPNLEAASYVGSRTFDLSRSWTRTSSSG